MGRGRRCRRRRRGRVGGGSFVGVYSGWDGTGWSVWRGLFFRWGFSFVWTQGGMDGLHMISTLLHFHWIGKAYGYISLRARAQLLGSHEVRN